MNTKKYFMTGLKVFILESIMGILYFIFNSIPKITVKGTNINVAFMLLFGFVLIFINIFITGYLANKLFKWN